MIIKRIKLNRRALKKELRELLELKRMEDEFWRGISMEEPSKRWQKEFWQIVSERKRLGYKYVNWPQHMGIITPAQKIWLERKGFTVHEYFDVPACRDFVIHFGKNVGMMGAIENYLQG